MKIFYLIIALSFLSLFSGLASSASFQYSAERPEHLILDEKSSHYAIVSKATSSGFLPAPPGMSLFQTPAKDVLTVIKQHSDSTRLADRSTYPDYKQHPRYWLHTTVVNNANAEDWVFHVSNFGVEEIHLLITYGNKTQRLEFNSDLASSHINTLGRAIDVRLPRDIPVDIVVELDKSRPGWTPYLGLMSKSEYETWSTKTSYLYDIAIGVIIGIILLSLACWLVVRDVTFLWAALSSFLLTCYYLEHGRIPYDLWGYSYSQHPLYWYLMSATFLSLLGFSASFLKIRETDQRWYRLFIFVSVSTAVFAPLTHLMPINLIHAVFFLDYLFILILVMLASFRKNQLLKPYYLLYRLGWAPILISLLHTFWYFIGVDKNIDQVEASYKMIWSLYIHIVHIFFHTIAMALNVRDTYRKKNEAERLSQAKSQFMAYNSHDLHQPLYSMQLHIDALRAINQQAQTLQLLDKLEAASQAMKGALESVMDLNKLEAGAIEAEFSDVAIASMFAELEQSFSHLALQKEVQLTFSKTTARIHTDPFLLLRVLSNLVSNAIKYTDSGRILVGVRRRKNAYEIQVLDTGRGIDLETQKTIFDIYQRSNDSESLQVQGSGIGLSIVKHLSELLGYTVKLTSQPYKGSVFSVLIPIKIFDQATHKSNRTVQNNFGIQLYLNNDATRSIIHNKLTEWGYRVLSHRTFNVISLKDSSEPVLVLCDDDAFTYIDDNVPNLSEKNNHLILVCVTKKSETIKKPWLAFKEPILDTKLRALVNHSERIFRSL